MSARLRLTKLLTQTVRRRPKPVEEAAKLKKHWNIVRGDLVQVIGNHPESGKQGKVSVVLRKKDRVIVEGVNVKPKHIKGDKERGIQGRTVQRERTIPYSKVSLVDPVTNTPTRIYKKYLDDGTKVRVSKKSGSIIPRPEILLYRRRPVNTTVTDSDTKDASDVWEITYQPQSPSSSATTTT